MGYKENYEKWLKSSVVDDATKAELEAVSGNEPEIEARFSAMLDFGTAGLRGIMRAGLNGMNIYTVRYATQGLANLILQCGENYDGGVSIAFDSRVNSPEFAREAACVLAANGIRAHLFDELRPTPELSFALRENKSIAGINVTASHNTKEYNGYKVYWSDGAQLPPQHAQAIAAEREKLDIFNGFSSMDYEEAVQKGIIELLDESTDEAFLKEVLGQAVDRDIVAKVADDFKIVYTPFHGCGYKLVPEALKRLGIKHLYPVPEQMVIDGTFPTVDSPNPENPEGFALAIDLARKVDSDLIIGTDPDSDRIGVLVRSGDGEYKTISGNQMGVLLLDYLIQAKKRTGTMPAKPGVVKSIVTTEMARKVCTMNEVHIEDTFTGFKFMAERIAQWEAEGSYSYIFAYEESYGYMVGDYVRDKDAVTASMLVAEMAAYYRSRGMTLLDALQELYRKYGYYMEKTLNLVMPGLDGLKKMKDLMDRLRAEPLKEISGVPVEQIRDYQDGTITVAGLGKVGETGIKGSNVMYFELSDETNFIVRPSGTEPKIKVYILASGKNMNEAQTKVDKYSSYAESMAD